MRIILYIFLLFPFAGIAQQKETRGGLLWRISGKGLLKPSYLYGTMHMTDSRIFNFGDSLYAALEKSDGYAMELNPDSLMMEYFNENDDEEKLMLKDALNIKDFNRVKKKLGDRFDKPAEKVTVKEFRNYFRDWVNLLNEKGSMQTFMDAYFYDIARRQGKWVGGIEDVPDQKNIMEEEPLESYVQDFLHNNRESKQHLEAMISAYNRDDLKQVQMMDSFATAPADTIMLRRNIKMARRIDSLAHIRNIFFAIGTLHLPGDSGVVNLLRRRGFTVEPVISSKRIHANNYKFLVKELPWVTVKSGTGLYSVEMPGEPHNTLMDYDNMDMKIYADISTNLYYLTMGATGKKNMNEDSVMKQFVSRLHGNTKVMESRAIKKDSISGKEVVVSANKIVYRVQMFLNAGNIYMLLVGSPAGKAIYSADAERFLRSFTFNKNFVNSAGKWQAVNSHTGGFSVLFPGKPMIKRDTHENNEKSNVVTTLYSAIDMESDIYFQLMEQDLKKGYFLNGDKSSFKIYVNNLAANPSCRVISTKMDSIQHYPAMWVEFMLESENDSFYTKALNIHRGNRIFYLFATAQDAKKGKPAIDNFFTSFSFKPVQESVWSIQDAPDKSFSTWAPAPIEHYGLHSTEGIYDISSGETFYDIYDSTAPVTFFVKKTAYSRFTWVADDTSLMRLEVNANVKYNDSLLEYKLIRNGDYTGVEAIVQMADNHNLKKMRLLLVGDTLVNIYGITAREFIDKENCRRFFDDMRINHAKPPGTLFNNKAKELTDSLRSKDSAVFAQAKRSLYFVKFTKQDLPLLHKAMLEWNSDTAEYDNTNEKLFSIVATLEDESTLQVVKQAYEQLPADKEKMRYDLLLLLTSQKTAQSYALMKELFLAHPPKDLVSYKFFNSLRDSFALLAPVFPDLLPLLKDSANKWHIISLAEQLLDSGLINKTVVLAWKKDIYDLATADIKGWQKNNEGDGWYDAEQLVKLLGILKEAEANTVLQKYLLQPNKYLQYTAAIALLKNDQPVSAAQLTKLAADNTQRIDLYNDLKELKKGSLFPKQYLTQQAFAESELYNSFGDDDDYAEKKFTLLGERIIIYKGEKRKFYLFKVDMSAEDEKVTHLGVAGPYSLTFTRPEMGSEATGIFWSKEYKLASINADFRAYLKDMQAPAPALE